jgi:hypothetical protein
MACEFLLNFRLQNGAPRVLTDSFLIGCAICTSFVHHKFFCLFCKFLRHSISTHPPILEPPFPTRQGIPFFFKTSRASIPEPSSRRFSAFSWWTPLAQTLRRFVVPFSIFVLREPIIACRALGPRNLMKITPRQNRKEARSGKVELTMDKSRLFGCLIRSVRD